MGGGGVPSGGVYRTDASSLKKQWKPNSIVHRYRNGKKVQSRWYGPDGKAIRNRDYKHGGKNLFFPHDHQWNWQNTFPRGQEHLIPDYINYREE
ncbi:MAG: hypothetical protein PHC46_01110 [Clostridia bacterium]|nr:hypothetical protein [Clostridia bacterium]